MSSNLFCLLFFFCSLSGVHSILAVTWWSRDYQVTNRRPPPCQHTSRPPVCDPQTSSWTNHCPLCHTFSLCPRLLLWPIWKKPMPSSQPLLKSSHEFWLAISSQSKQFLKASWNLTNSFHYIYPISSHFWPLQQNLRQSSHAITPTLLSDIPSTLLQDSHQQPSPSNAHLSRVQHWLQATRAWQGFLKAFKHKDNFCTIALWLDDSFIWVLVGFWGTYPETAPLLLQ